MSLTANKTQNELKTGELDDFRASGKRSWAALILAILEAACVFAIGAAKSGLLLGSIAGFMAGWTVFLHRDFVRIPALLAAILLSLINLFLLLRFVSLRSAAAAAWRKRPLTGRDRLRIGMVLSLSLVTLALALAEIYFHRQGHHTIL